MVRGATIPLALNPVPVTPTCMTCTSVCPEFFKVTAWVLLPFTRTLPKFNEVALSDSCEADLPDDPRSFTFDDPLPCEVIAVKVPELSPEVVPVYVTWNFAD
jgi:hypothetical protein